MLSRRSPAYGSGDVVDVVDGFQLSGRLSLIL